MSIISTAPTSSRVWIYQSNRPFSEAEIGSLRIKVQVFAKHWVSHNNALRAWGEILQGHFILLMVDESRAGASGCSIDKSVYFMQSVENEYGVILFDRLLFAYKDANHKIHVVSKNVFADLYQQGVITDKTIVFNNLVKNKKELDEKWEVALGDSWHKRFV